MPSRGLERVAIRVTKAETSRRGSIAALIISMPMNRMPMPASSCPMCWEFGCFRNTIIATPAKAARGASAPTSRAMSRPVVVLPTLAPIISHTAWFRLSIPALTNPTTITVVAEEDCTAVVISAPTRIPIKRLEVRRSRTLFIWLPAAASRPELIICIPCRNSASPPRRPNMIVKLIVTPLPSLYTIPPEIFPFSIVAEIPSSVNGEDLFFAAFS
jgi:hypothetical protein